MFLTDTHCHLDREFYPDGLEPVFENAIKNNVRRMLFAGSTIKSSWEAVETARAFTGCPEIWAAAGVHPHEASSMPDGVADELRALALDERVVAVGEIGLDYFYDLSPRELQKKVFGKQIELAKEINKPVMLHIRDAKDKASGDAMKDALDILREHHAEKCGGVVHCFCGYEEEARQALDLGFYISFAGPLTFKRNIALRETASNLPLDRILCETDSPYLAPEPFRGRTNEPCHVLEIYKLLALLRKTDIETLAQTIDENGCRLYGWGKKDV